MKEQQTLDTFRSGPVSTAVLKNAVPAMIAMLMVLIYLPALFVLQTIMGINGLIWAQPVADVLSLLLAIGLFVPCQRAMKAGGRTSEAN